MPYFGVYRDAAQVTASHLFAYKHGQDAMDDIFGKIPPKELFSSRNGIIMSAEIEMHSDSGVLAIVPDLPDKPTASILSFWANQYVRDYKVHITDNEWPKLDKQIFPFGELKWRNLDNRKLQFQSRQRPAARYLYFHYCIQVLRRAWKAGPGMKAGLVLKDEFDKPVWATPGRYIARNMLLAFIEEVGNENESLMLGASCRKGNNRNALVDVATAQIASKGDEKTDSEDEDSEL